LLERLDLLQQQRDRLLEVECLSGHGMCAGNSPGPAA
jgi:hypothetical protein